MTGDIDDIMCNQYFEQRREIVMTSCVTNTSNNDGRYWWHHVKPILRTMTEDSYDIIYIQYFDISRELWHAHYLILFIKSSLTRPRFHNDNYLCSDNFKFKLWRYLYYIIHTITSCERWWYNVSSTKTNNVRHLVNNKYLEVNQCVINTS